MRGMLARLSTHEEAALRKIGFGSDDLLEPTHVRRLLDLLLIEWVNHTWRLTAVGRQRYGTLVASIGRHAPALAQRPQGLAEQRSESVHWFAPDG